MKNRKKNKRTKTLPSKKYNHFDIFIYCLGGAQVALGIIFLIIAPWSYGVEIVPGIVQLGLFAISCVGFFIMPFYYMFFLLTKKGDLAHITILALSAIVFYFCLETHDNIRSTRLMQTREQAELIVHSSLEPYYQRNNRYPDTLKELRDLNYNVPYPALRQGDFQYRIIDRGRDFILTYRNQDMLCSLQKGGGDTKCKYDWE